MSVPHWHITQESWNAALTWVRMGHIHLYTIFFKIKIRQVHISHISRLSEGMWKNLVKLSEVWWNSYRLNIMWRKGSDPYYAYYKRYKHVHSSYIRHGTWLDIVHWNISKSCNKNIHVKDLDFKRHMSWSFFVFSERWLSILVELLTITV